ncbi:MAG: ssl1498 family light-harvesting-like protein [Cyanobacteria bacterium P01_C01_bin.89]
MYTTVNESGQINNYANEPEMYYSYYPSNWEQGRYAKLGALATAFIGVVLMTAVVVTSIA